MQRVTNENTDLKRRLSDYETLIKLQVENLNRDKLEMDKLKEENQKLKGELVQARTELERTGDSVIDLAKANSKQCY